LRDEFAYAVQSNVFDILVVDLVGAPRPFKVWAFVTLKPDSLWGLIHWSLLIDAERV